MFRRYNISRLAAVVLQNRDNLFGSDEKPEGSIYSYSLLKDIDKAVARIKYALINNEHISIYGDYDADGVTATAILYMYLTEQGASVDCYIPDRVEQGYGLHNTALESLKQNGTNLVITVDTGVTANEQIEYAKILGLDVIITDHHECKRTIPDCVAVINPKRVDCPYPFKELAGVGVVLKLLEALQDGRDFEQLAQKYIGLVCIGTVADVVPLVDENRALVSLGLKNIAQRNNIGINALLEATNLIQKQITAGHIGFIIAPRINAAGRLANANKSLELFLCDDQKKALAIALQLSQENRNRQQIEEEIFKQAVEIVEQNELYKNSVIVVAHKNWHSGVIGIVSSKITEKYHRPSILISIDGQKAKGSGRSISGFDLFRALDHSKNHLLQFGGHSLAAGLSLETDSIKPFERDINEYADTILDAESFVPVMLIDAAINNSDLSIDNISGLSLLEPYGMGNPQPIFSFENAQALYINTLSEGKHLKIIAKRDGLKLEAIGFGMGNLVENINCGDNISIAGNLNINEYFGKKNVQLFIKDIKII